MQGWRFSWSATIGWILGAVAAGAVVGMTLSICNIMISPDEMDEFALDSVVLVGLGALAFLVLAGAPVLVSSLVWRVARFWPRPWAEMLLCAGVCFALTHWLGVNISFDANAGHAGTPDAATIAAFAINIAPVIAGVIGPLVYWLIAKPKRV